jgi:N-acyl-phosphatidylethanolamine-hydrolysing phospholipase D
MLKRIAFICICLPVVLVSCVATPPSFDETVWQQTVDAQDSSLLYAPHFEDGVYFNPWMPMQTDRLGKFLKWRLSKKAVYTHEEQTHLPRVRPDLAGRIQKTADKDSIAWVGHATFLIRTAGVTWLTDPMLSKRALLPKRVTPPAMLKADLNKITDPLYVLISHNHYDHLDKDTIRSLPAHARIFVPPGLKGTLASFFGGHIQEVDWWERVDLGGGIQLISLPAQHWSRRIGQDFNTSLWASYLLVTPGATIYYGGDSGYFVGYREIGKQYPGIDYALMPLTAYHPRWFMHYAHMNASETIQAFQDLGARYFIPTQWGTFQLGDNPPGYPVLDLKKTITQQNLDPDPFVILDIGQMEMMPKDK